MSHLLLTWAATSAFADPRLSSAAYVVEVTGPLARIVVEQTWVNEGDVPIDGLYVFPLDGTLAVDAMELTVGDRRLVGEVLALQEATVAYQAAVANGQTAALTTQQRPDVFMQRVGNLRPGEVVQVRLSAIQPVSSAGGAYELTLPLVVGPRFVTARQWSEGLPLAPVAALTAPDTRARIEVTLTSGVPVADLSSPSHDMLVWASPRSAELVTSVALDRDFVLRWTVPASQPRAALYVQDGHALLTVDPPSAWGRPASAVLTDVSLDWGDWVVERPWPRRLPDLQVGQPLLTGVRVVRRGTKPVVVRGQLASGPWSVSLQPQDVPTGRAIPSTWARQVIADLEYEAVADPSLADEILALSLEYQVLSRRSAFLVVDPAGVPYGEASVERGQVLSRDFLQKVPAGRSYQSAVQMAAGVSGSTGNENTYMLDGADITDPTTGTYARNDEVLVVEASAAAVSPPHGETVAYPGGPLPSARVPPMPYLPVGTNNLDALLEVGHDERVGDPMTSDHVLGLLSGPVVRDQLWAHAAFDGDRSRLGDRAYDGGRGALTLTGQPTSDHMLTAHATVSLADLVDDGRYTRDEAGALGRWQWFVTSSGNLDTQAGATRLDLDGDVVSRQHARSALTFWDVGSHDLTFGADADRTAAALDGGWTEEHVGADLPDDVDLLRVGGFAEDSWRPWSRLTVLAGARVDGVLDRAHVGPRGSVAWDPFGDDKTRLAVSFGRRFGHLGLLSLVGEDGLSRQDGWLASAQRELVRDLALGVEGDLRDQRDVPTFGGGRVDTRSVASTVFLRKIPGNRWVFTADWRRVHLLDGVPATRLDDGSLDAYRDIVRGLVSWDLPTDPWTHTIALAGDVRSGPLGVVVPDPTTTDQPNAAYASVSLQLTQHVDVREGTLYARLEGRYLTPLADDRDLSPWVVVSPTLTQADWAGARLGASVGYSF